MEKTEAATPKKREEARDDGQVPRSQDLTIAVTLLGSAMLLKVVGPVLGSSVLSAFGTALSALSAGPLDGTTSVALLREVGFRTGLSVAIWGAASAGIALAITGVQARGMWSGKAVAPKWERMSPMQNAKKIGGVQSLAEAAKSLLKLGIVAIAVRSALGAAWPNMMALSQQSAAGFLEVVRLYSGKLLVTAGLCYLALGAFDYLWQVWRFEKQLMMSKDEVKQEMKQSEGDPLVKQRMRSMGRSLARRQMMKEVPKADVVITNPTHIAVALKYDPDVAPAPIVVAMGLRKVAERIKALAKESGVPTIENKPLARALLASARVGTMIPGELYLAVAEILAFVIRRRLARGAALGQQVYA